MHSPIISTVKYQHALVMLEDKEKKVSPIRKKMFSEKVRGDNSVREIKEPERPILRVDETIKYCIQKGHSVGIFFLLVTCKPVYELLCKLRKELSRNLTMKNTL